VAETDDAAIRGRVTSRGMTNVRIRRRYARELEKRSAERRVDGRRADGRLGRDKRSSDVSPR